MSPRWPISATTELRAELDRVGISYTKAGAGLFIWATDSGDFVSARPTARTPAPMMARVGNRAARTARAAAGRLPVGRAGGVQVHERSRTAAMIQRLPALTGLALRREVTPARSTT
jgi:hypothetical protein